VLTDAHTHTHTHTRARARSHARTTLVRYGVTDQPTNRPTERPLLALTAKLAAEQARLGTRAVSPVRPLLAPAAWPRSDHQAGLIDDVVGAWCRRLVAADEPLLVCVRLWQAGPGRADDRSAAWYKHSGAHPPAYHSQHAVGPPLAGCSKSRDLPLTLALLLLLMLLMLLLPTQRLYPYRSRQRYNTGECYFSPPICYHPYSYVNSVKPTTLGKQTAAGHTIHNCCICMLHIEQNSSCNDQLVQE